MGGCTAALIWVGVPARPRTSPPHSGMFIPRALLVHGLLAQLQALTSGYVVEFGAPRLVGSSNVTHYWFPSGGLIELGDDDGSDAVIVQRIKQSGDGGICPPKEHPSLPCSELRVSDDRGSTWLPGPPVAPTPSRRYGPENLGPFPLLPETTLNHRRARNPRNFSSIHAFLCVNASCTGEIVQWGATISRSGGSAPAGEGGRRGGEGGISPHSRAWDRQRTAVAFTPKKFQPVSVTAASETVNCCIPLSL